jgi:putative ABC transport system permease protein
MSRAIRLLNLRRLGRVRLRMVLAVVAVAAGSSLALSVVIVNGSTTYSLNRLTQQVGGEAGLRVVGATNNGGITFAAVAAAVRTPGVKTVIPVVEAISAVRTNHSKNQDVLVIGVNCAGGAVSGGLGCTTASSGSHVSLPASDALYIAPSLQQRLSSTSWLETNLGLESLRHAIALPSLNAVNRGDVVVMSLAAAQSAFTRHGRVDAVYVVPAAGVSVTALQHRLAQAVGPQNGVVSATSAPPLVSLAVGAFAPILALLAIVASAIAVVLVYNVITLTLEERRRERAIVAAIGASPATLIVGPLLEAGLLGAVGGLLGTLVGVALARPILSTLSRITQNLVGIPITEHATSNTFIVGIVVGLAIGLLAAVIPVRRAMRADIAAEISGREQRAATSKRATLRRALVYLALAVTGTVVSWLGARNGSLKPWQPNAALVGFIVATVFSIMALGAWAPVTIRGIWRRSPLGHGIARLGVANLVREPGRTGVMAVAIGAAVGVAFITASYNHAIDQDIAAGYAKTAAHHSVLVTTAASNNGFNFDGQIPPAVEARLARLPGVLRADEFNGEITGHAAGQLVLVESNTHPSFATWTVYEGTASRNAFDRGETLVGANLARRDHLHAGSTVALDTPTGLAQVRIQGIWNNGDATGDNISMPISEQNRLYGTQWPSSLILVVAPSVSPDSVARAARAEHLGAYLKYSTPTKQLQDADAGISSQLAPFNVLQKALLLVSFVTVLSTLLLVGLQRRREFGLLGAVGMTPREMFGMVMTEGLTISVVAVVLGAVFGFVVLAVMLNVTPLLVGYVDTYSPDLTSLFIYGPIAIVVAVAAAIWPGRVASRTPILEALNYE